MTSILKVDELQDTSGNLIIKEDSNTITVGASGDTITIPSGATITNSGTATGFGLTMANTFRMTSDLSVTSSTLSTISSNLEATDTSGQGSIGSAMTESSGIYTFPSTGIYLVEGVFQCVRNGGSQWIQTTLDVTTNNSSYTKVADGEGSISHVASANTSQSIRNSSLIDVTDTSNVKVRFQIAAAQSITLKGNTSYNYTYFNFIRLGDT